MCCSVCELCSLTLLIFQRNVSIVGVGSLLTQLGLHIVLQIIE